MELLGLGQKATWSDRASASSHYVDAETTGVENGPTSPLSSITWNSVSSYIRLTVAGAGVTVRRAYGCAGA